MTRVDPDKLPRKYRLQASESRDRAGPGGRARLVILGQLPALNEILDACKKHWSCYSSLKKEYSEIVRDMAVINKIPFFPEAELEITYYCPDRRKDPDNISAGGKKFILDGLVSAGVLEDDSWKCIKGFKESWKVDKGKPRVEITLIDVSK